MMAGINNYIINIGHCVSVKQIKVGNNPTQQILKNKAICMRTDPLEILSFVALVQFSSVQFSSVQFSSVQFSSVQFSSVQFSCYSDIPLAV